MNWQEIIITVVSAVVLPFLTWGAERLIALINAKVKNTKYARYLTDAVDVVTRAVKTTYQTYVEGLKGKDIFTKEAQVTALNMAKDITLKQLTDDTKKFINDNFGDVGDWIVNTIESVLYDLKNRPAEVKADA